MKATHCISRTVVETLMDVIIAVFDLGSRRAQLLHKVILEQGINIADFPIYIIFSFKIAVNFFVKS